MDVGTKIREYAREIFAKEGVEGISMRRIADHVGVTPTAIYRHFEDKQTLISTIVDEGFELLERQLVEGGKGRTGESRLLGILDAYTEFAIDYPNYFDLMFLVPRSNVRRFPEDFRMRESASFNLLLDHVAEMMDQGQLKQDDTLEVAMAIWAEAHGLVSLYRCGRFGDQPGRLRRLMKRSIRRVIDGLA